jgi:hypothetical protein
VIVWVSQHLPDAHVIVAQYLGCSGEYRFTVSPDHGTPSNQSPSQLGFGNLHITLPELNAHWLHVVDQNNTVDNTNKRTVVLDDGDKTKKRPNKRQRIQ